MTQVDDFRCTALSGLGACTPSIVVLTRLALPPPMLKVARSLFEEI